MTPEMAIKYVIKEFPFEGYISPLELKRGIYLNIAATVMHYLKPGSKILDFGCGPCDKAAMLQYLGYECTGYDDLGDNWHKIAGNREKIILFTRKCGIDFKIASMGCLPFKKNSFKMVMAIDVLEHLHDSPRDLLDDLLELVDAEGYLFITVPNAVNIRKRIDVLRGKTNYPSYESYFWYPGSWRGHIREYVKGDLIKLCKYLNLEILELKSCDHMLKKLPPKFWPIYNIITGIFKGWKDSWLLIARKKPGWIALKKCQEIRLI